MPTAIIDRDLRETDARTLRQISTMDVTAGDAETLQRIAAQLESDAKRFEDSEKLQAIGKSAFESIAEMVAALECDYDRLAELRADCESHGEGWADCYRDEAAELAELEEAAGECTSREDAERRIQEDPLSIQMRGDWYGYGTEPADAAEPVEFEILLGTGGPAVRIIGELYSGEPTRARLQVQDWFLPWTEYIGADRETLLTYCRCFYFGEG